MTAPAELSDDELAEVATATLPCPEGFYWRRATGVEYYTALAEGDHTLILRYSNESSLYTKVYMVAVRQGSQS